MTALHVDVGRLTPAVDAPPSADATASPDIDRRWTAWLARGRVNDARTRRRMTRVLWLGAAGFLLWLTWGVVS